MKPGYKIIIAGLLVYAGFQVKAVMDVAPYKEKAAEFAGLLKEHKSFAAQALLETHLQEIVSIETLERLIREQNLTEVKEISWEEWRGKEGNYTLRGTFVFEGAPALPVVFSLISTEENKTWISDIRIGERDLRGSPSDF